MKKLKIIQLIVRWRCRIRIIGVGGLVGGIVGLLGVDPLGVEVAGVVLLVGAGVGPLGVEVEAGLLKVGPLGVDVLALFSSLILASVLSVLKLLASFYLLKWVPLVVELNCLA